MAVGTVTVGKSGENIGVVDADEEIGGFWLMKLLISDEVSEGFNPVDDAEV